MINTIQLPPFKKMCVTIGNLPTSFMESMSYYEALCWLVGFLQDQVVPAVNTNSEAVQELQNYVANYFDNLDVQEEINNKLDDMAESGELTEIIAQYLSLAGVLAFDTVADMKVATNIIDGSTARTLGFNAKGDGGAAVYKIREITNDDTVNEMDIIALTNNDLIAELVSDKNNCMCYGVDKDDTNDNNNTIISYVLGKMDYAYCNEEIELHDELVLSGNNKRFDFSKITFTPSNATDSAITIHDTTNYIVNGTHLVSSSHGVRLGLLELTSGVQVNILRITARENAIYLGGAKGVWDSQLNVNRVEYKNHGIYFDVSQTWVGQVGFYNTVFIDQTSDATTENFGVYGNCSLNPITGIDFYNISFEKAKGGFKFETTHSTNFCEHLNVYGCRIAEFSRNHHYKALKLVTPNSNNNILIQGVFNFDSALIETFDLSEYYSMQSRSMFLNGIFMLENTANNNGQTRLAKTAQLGNRCISLKELYINFTNYKPSAASTIYPLGNITLLSRDASYQAPYTYNIKLKDSTFNFIGTYKFKAMNDCTVNLVGSSGSVIKTYSLTSGQTLNVTSVETNSSNDVQTLSDVVDDVSFETIS